MTPRASLHRSGLMRSGFDKLPDRRIDAGKTERHRIAPRVFEDAGNHVSLRNVDEFRRAGVLLQWIDERLIERL